MQREYLISFWEDRSNVERLDQISQAIGVDRSGLLRMLVRARLRQEADSK